MIEEVFHAPCISNYVHLSGGYASMRHNPIFTGTSHSFTRSLPQCQNKNIILNRFWNLRIDKLLKDASDELKPGIKNFDKISGAEFKPEKLKKGKNGRFRICLVLEINTNRYGSKIVIQKLRH